MSKCVYISKHDFVVVLFRPFEIFYLFSIVSRSGREAKNSFDTGRTVSANVKSSDRTTEP